MENWLTLGLLLLRKKNLPPREKQQALALFGLANNNSPGSLLSPVLFVKAREEVQRQQERLRLLEGQLNRLKKEASVAEGNGFQKNGHLPHDGRKDEKMRDKSPQAQNSELQRIRSELKKAREVLQQSRSELERLQQAEKETPETIHRAVYNDIPRKLLSSVSRSRLHQLLKKKLEGEDIEWDAIKPAVRHSHPESLAKKYQEILTLEMELETRQFKFEMEWVKKLKKELRDVRHLKDIPTEKLQDAVDEVYHKHGEAIGEIIWEKMLLSRRIGLLIDKLEMLSPDEQEQFFSEAYHREKLTNWRKGFRLIEFFGLDEEDEERV